MIEALPWPVELGVYSLGWGLFGATVWLLIRKLMSGDLMTRREGDALVERAVKAETAAEALVKQNGQLMDMAQLGTATWQALKKAAE